MRSFKELMLRAYSLHTRMHFIQEMHFLESVFFGSFSEMAPAGQTLAQEPHSVHLVESVFGVSGIVLYLRYGEFPGTCI